MNRSLLALVAMLSVFVAVVSSVVSAQQGGPPPVAIGAPAPQFSLQDQDGNTVTLAQFRGRIVVLEWFNYECPYVVKHYREGHMNALAARYAERGVVWLAINSSHFITNERHRAIAAQWNINRPLLNDASGVTGRAYGARTTPHMYIIDTAGNLAYMGAIDSIRSANTADIAAATNHVAAALDDLLAGRPVAVPETRPYGCTVKYAP